MYYNSAILTQEDETIFKVIYYTLFLECERNVIKCHHHLIVSGIKKFEILDVL